MADEKIVRIAIDEEVYRYGLGTPDSRVIGERLKERGMDIEPDLKHILVHWIRAVNMGLFNKGVDMATVLYIPKGQWGSVEDGYFPSADRAEESFENFVDGYVNDHFKFGACSPFSAITNGARYSNVRKAFEKQGCRVIDLTKRTEERLCPRSVAFQERVMQKGGIVIPI